MASRILLRRKFETFVSDPQRVLLQKSRRLLSFVAHERLRRIGVLESLRLRPADAIPPDPLDLWRLYSEVRHLKPAVVLELGAGCSTNVLAFAVRQNGIGRVISLDADARWAEIARDQVPTELRAWCEVRQCGVSVVERDGVRAIVHDSLPDLVPDLIYLDGPAPVDGVTVARDVVDLESRLRPGAVVIVDGREDNVAFMKRSLTRKWKIKRDRIAGATRMVLVQ